MIDNKGNFYNLKFGEVLVEYTDSRPTRIAKASEFSNSDLIKRKFNGKIVPKKSKIEQDVQAIKFDAKTKVMKRTKK